MQRDYDKEPIVIKDYNYIFRFAVAVPFAVCFILAYIYNPFNLDETSSLKSNFFIVFPIIFMPFIMVVIRAINKRTILLNKKQIILHHGVKILETIETSDIKLVRKTFVDFYHISQKNSTWAKILSILFFPVAILILVFLVIVKIFFHIVHSKGSFYMFYDSIIIFDNNGRFINILFTSDEIYNEVYQYFLSKNIDIKKCDSFYLLSHNLEKINYMELK